jgi:predicted DNA-binding transcriptional regulator AlpA
MASFWSQPVATKSRSPLVPPPVQKLLSLDDLAEVLGVGRTLTAPLEKLLSLDDLAELLGVKRRTVDRWWRCGKLPQPLRLGHSGKVVIRFRPSDISAFLEEVARGK